MSTPGTPECTCDDYRHTCNAAALGIEVSEMTTRTTDILQNLGQHDIETYLLQTFDTYALKRYAVLNKKSFFLT